MKLCKDCKYIEIPKYFFIIPMIEFAKCKHDSCCDAVTGGGESYCSTQRIFNCNREAKNFEAKA